MSALWSIGVDPGSTVGLALLRESKVGGPPRAVALMSPTGHEAAIDVLDRWLRYAIWPGERVVATIERVEKVFPVVRRGSPGISSRMATALVHSAETATEIRAFLRPRAATILELPAAHWRRALLGTATPSDAQIALTLARLEQGGQLLGLPRRTNCHERDAIGLARHGLLWARTPQGREAIGV